jgi:hypothetical protein
MSTILRNLMQNGREVAQSAQAGENFFVHSRNGCKVMGAAPAFIPAVRNSQLLRTPSKNGQRADGSALLPVFFDNCSVGAGFGQRPAPPFQTRKTAAGLPTRDGFMCDIPLNQRDL